MLYSTRRIGPDEGDAQVKFDEIPCFGKKPGCAQRVVPWEGPTQNPSRAANDWHIPPAVGASFWVTSMWQYCAPGVGSEHSGIAPLLETEFPLVVLVVLGAPVVVVLVVLGALAVLVVLGSLVVVELVVLVVLAVLLVVVVLGDAIEGKAKAISNANAPIVPAAAGAIRRPRLMFAPPP